VNISNYLNKPGTMETKLEDDDSKLFRFPGEFEPHTGTWMLWPQRPDCWRENAAPAQRVFARVAAEIARFEPVTMCVSGALYDSACEILKCAVEETMTTEKMKNEKSFEPVGRIRVLEMSSNDAWMRDVGPTFLVNDRTGELRGLDWTFNAWVYTILGTMTTQWLEKCWQWNVWDDIVCQSQRLLWKVELFILMVKVHYWLQNSACYDAIRPRASRRLKRC
jgi:hypothetical protein